MQTSAWKSGQAKDRDMSLSSSRLRDSIITHLDSKGIVVGGHEGCRDTTDYMLKWAEAIAEAVVEEITTNARCSGNDSDGDSHDNVQII